MNSRKRVFLQLFVAAVSLFMAFPIVAIVVLSFSSGDYLQFPPPSFSLRWYREIANDSDWSFASLASIQAGVTATCCTLALGLPASLAIVRGQFRGKGAVHGLIMSPVLVPHILTAIGIYYVIAPFRWQGSLLLIGLSHVIVCLPIFVTMVVSSLQGVDFRLEQAAASLGASRFTAFRKVTLPLIMPAVAGGVVFSFLASFDEVIIALMLSTRQSETLPVRIWNSMTLETNPVVTAVSSYLILLTFAALGLTVWARRRTARTTTKQAADSVERSTP